MTPSSLIKEVSNYLSDQEIGFEFEHWSERDIFYYFRLAVKEVALVKKEMFTRPTTVQLTAGSQQQLPLPCEGSTDKYVTDASGKPIRALTSKLSQLLGDAPCGVVDGAYAPTGIRYDDANPRSLFIEPPVPEGTTSIITVNCFVPPSPKSVDEDLDIPESLEPAIFELMLYYGFGVDTESTPARERSNAHWAHAMTLLGVSQRAVK